MAGWARLAPVAKSVILLLVLLLVLVLETLSVKILPTGSSPRVPRPSARARLKLNVYSSTSTSTKGQPISQQALAKLASQGRTENGLKIWPLEPKITMR